MVAEQGQSQAWMVKLLFTRSLDNSYIVHKSRLGTLEQLIPSVKVSVT